MIILDTNVLSEITRARPAASVIAWARAQDPDAIVTTGVNEAELLYGIALMPEGRNRAALHRATKAMLTLALADRVLPFDRAAAAEYAEWAADRKRAGRPVAIADLQIAAIARARRAAAIATRNTRDFAECGVPIIDPWSYAGG